MPPHDPGTFGPLPLPELGAGDLLPRMLVALPAPRSAATVDALSRHECPGLTARRARRAELSGASHDPIVYRAARGANVLDLDGNRYVDLVAGFGAALIGHTHPAVVTAIQSQAPRLLHALGDVFPSEEKVRLEATLAAMAPWPARVILGISGADAVEAALKTARLATGRSGVLAFHGGYHGLSYGTVAACGYKSSFRAPFEGQLNPGVRFIEYPRPDGGDLADSLQRLDDALATGEVGAVLIEPILGRGGVSVPPPGSLEALGARARARGALVIADEIYTGLGRCGALFRSVSEGLVPDAICLGKALGGGVAVSACLLREEVATCWASASGEALHTSTFLGNPLSCAAALAAIEVLCAPETSQRIAHAARSLCAAIEAMASGRSGDPVTTSGAGLLVGVSMRGGHRRALAVSRALLERGYVTLLGGRDGDALTLTPPMVLTEAQAEGFASALDAALDEVAP